ncbi:MAG: glutamate 5-kinase [Phycisphaeraceae bacterium]|nr:glutamate 5-kinase [Phycisphaeraceae bacterium]
MTPGATDPLNTARTVAPVRRLVVKVGSAVLARAGRLDDRVLERFAGQIAGLHARGVLTTVVSSGAVASGFRLLGKSAPPKTIVAKQAAAALGQHRLMSAWAAALQGHGLSAAQILYTADDLEDRRRFVNARRTLEELLSRGAVPIVNENDSISFAEIRLGDNDRLSALTANLVGADLLLILSSVQGLSPRDQPGKVIATVADADEARAHVRPERSATGVGGMATKVESAAMCAAWGIPTVIAGGAVDDVITRVVAGERIGTLFVPSARRTPSRKRWLAGAARSRGTITIDEGAARALAGRNASLLASGVIGVRGEFERHDPVDIAGRDGTVIARGAPGYSAAEVRAIAGQRTDRIAAILGYAYADEVVHRNDLVLLARRGARP